MKLLRVAVLFCFLTSLAVSQLKIETEKYTLPNGLQVILHEDRSVPLVSVNVWYHVGSGREKVGKTGFAHLFEHMMFQGSQNVGDDKHFEMVQEAGGDLNGSTTSDRTNYYETIPSQFLEMALWLESDRMGFLLPAMTQEKLDNQRDVVKNERRQRYENQPYGRAFERIFALAYKAEHPYNWATIGSMEDLSAASMEDVKEFFQFYYAPNNASLVVAGDFNKKQTKEWIEKYFGSLPKGKEVSKPTTNQPTLENDVRDSMEDRVQLPRLYMVWHSTPLSGKDDAALDILANVIAGGKNSRLYKTLVYEKQIAQDVSAFQYSRELAGLFFVTVTAKPGVTLSELEKIVNEEIQKIQNEGITKRELERAKNSISTSFIYALQSIDEKADRINNYNIFWNDPNYINKDNERYTKVEAKNVQNVAKEYLTKGKVIFSVVPMEKKN